MSPRCTQAPDMIDSTPSIRKLRLKTTVLTNPLYAVNDPESLKMISIVVIPMMQQQLSPFKSTILKMTTTSTKKLMTISHHVLKFRTKWRIIAFRCFNTIINMDTYRFHVYKKWQNRALFHHISNMQKYQHVQHVYTAEPLVVHGVTRHQTTKGHQK